MEKLYFVVGLAVAIFLCIMIAYIIKKRLSKQHKNNLPYTPDNKLDFIAQQFSDKISTELKKAELKIRSVINNDTDDVIDEKEISVFK
jgi:hypothetical protein